MNPGVLRADDSVPLHSSKGVLVKRAHHELLCRTGYCIKKMGWGQGLTRVWKKALRHKMSLTLCSCSCSCCVKTTNWTRNFVMPAPRAVIAARNWTWEAARCAAVVAWPRRADSLSAQASASDLAGILVRNRSRAKRMLVCEGVRIGLRRLWERELIPRPLRQFVARDARRHERNL
jgi:hypothetical protein